MTLKDLREELELEETVKINATNCLGPCQQGAILVVYPEGVWYQGVTPEDVPELMQSHFIEGRSLERLLLTD